MNLALNNATNVIEYYRAKGEDVNVDVVTYGPGLHMLRADTSPVKDRIKSLKDAAFPSKIQFSACGNTKEGMEKKEGQPITVLSKAVVVPSGRRSVDGTIRRRVGATSGLNKLTYGADLVGSSLPQ